MGQFSVEIMRLPGSVPVEKSKSLIEQRVIPKCFIALHLAEE
jgi:hypothetical protein